MKKTVSYLTAIICTALCALLLFSTLAFGYIHFTIGSPERFSTGVADSIDADMLASEIYKSIDTACATYGIDSEPIKDYVAAKDLKKLASQYFAGYFTAFANGDESFPELTIDTEGLIDAVNASADNAKHKELYTSNEARIKLEEEFTSLLNGSVASLSYKTLYNKALEYRAYYQKLAELGKYFAPSLIALILVILLTAAYIIIKKKRSLAYVSTLTCLVTSALFAIPISYISGLDLAKRLNVSLGLAHIYINAAYDFLITKAALVYTVISAVILVAFAIAIASKVLSKKS
ncbi:MAG: hypothetical protein IJD67_01990 [Clostridia bacterium]|nr:hypothetical protein [Clostridia bacterium]